MLSLHAVDAGSIPSTPYGLIGITKVISEYRTRSKP